MNTKQQLSRLFFLVIAVTICSGIKISIAGDKKVPQNMPASQTARDVELKSGWKFIASNSLTGCEPVTYDDSKWEQVTIPHTWQSFADQSDFSNAWYRFAFDMPKGDKGKRIYIRFDGAGITATVYLNGTKMARHVGSYTAFVVDATDALNYGGRNVLAVMCDSKNDIAGNLSRPLEKQNNYWCVHGGIHRAVWLIKREPCHIDPQYFGSSGVFVTPDAVTSKTVSYKIKTYLRNAGATPKMIRVQHFFFGPAGGKVDEISGEVTLGKAGRDSIIVAGNINNPQLWSPNSPSLYRVKTMIFDREKAIDSLETVTGFKSLSLDNAGNFILNNEKVQLIGASIHEMHEKHFSAVLNEDIDEYLSWFNDIGFNSVFLSHYPPHPHAIDYTDRHGLMAWVENGYVNGSYEKEASANIVREMIYQNWNHPSIFCWSMGNETFLEMWYANRDLIKVAKSTGDRLRLFTANQWKSMNFGDDNLDFVSATTFYGWYGGNLWNNTLPHINQHGAGGLITQQQSYLSRNFKPSIWDPEGYQQIIAESASTHLYRKDSPNKLFFWWEMREHGEWHFYKRLNAKGLVTFGGYKKDAWYLFKSLNKPTGPLVHICGNHWFLRDVNELKVYSNLDEVHIQIKYGEVEQAEAPTAPFAQTLKNGQYQIDGISIRNVFFWKDILKPGRNEITVTGSNGAKDTAILYFMPGIEEKNQFLTDLKSGNGPVTFINRPVQGQCPFYSQFDGTANNTWDVIPDMIKGASWIATRRQSHPGWVTDISFTAKRDLDIYVVVDALPRKSLNAESQAGSPRWVIDQGFTDTGVRGQWRSSYFVLKDFVVMKKSVKAGESFKITPEAEPVDWVCLLK